jgi:2-polyprenyl-6-methoxyphenol hydroxylase-like FAD-dependent oxidoreductase
MSKHTRPGRIRFGNTISDTRATKDGMDTPNRKSVLISGASFAGLASAFWLKRAGYDVTLVELAPRFREGGTPVNIKGLTVDITKRMGLFDQVVANRLTTHFIEVWGPEGLLTRSDVRLAPEQEAESVEYEIERDVMTRLLFDLIEGEVEIVFGENVVSLREEAHGVRVDFSTGAPRTFGLVLGCDGLHSNIRDRWFGGEAVYSHFLGAYGSVTLVPRLLIEPHSLAIYQVPGRSVVLSTHHGKTDIITIFSSPERIAYDHHDRAEKVGILVARFGEDGWRVPDLLKEIERADNLYFSELAQIRMPAWSKGRVALVGDAAYCASPAAGMGGSLALDGAAAIGEALAASGDDHGAAFRKYEERFRPFVEGVQAAAVDFCEDVRAGKMSQADE